MSAFGRMETLIRNQHLPVGSHDNCLGKERYSDRERSHGRTGSDRGDQGEEGDKLIIANYTRRATEDLGPTSLNFTLNSHIWTKGANNWFIEANEKYY